MARLANNSAKQWHCGQGNALSFQMHEHLSLVVIALTCEQNMCFPSVPSIFRPPTSPFVKTLWMPRPMEWLGYDKGFS